MAHDLFISHSAQNRDVADAICTALEKAGIKCWVAPRDVRPGRTFPGEITRAIQQSKVMLLVFSRHSNNSEQVLREVQLATDSHLPIIRFRIEDVGLTDDLKYFLSTPHWLDALTPPLSEHIARLEVAIKELLNQSAEVTGRNVARDEVPSMPVPGTKPTPPSAMPPPLPAGPVTSKDFSTTTPKRSNPWPLLAIAALAIFAAIAGFIIIGFIRQPASKTVATPSFSPPPMTKVAQNSLPPAPSPKTTPVADISAERKSKSVSAFERAGSLRRPRDSNKDQGAEPKNAFDRAGNSIGNIESEGPESTPDEESD